MNPKAKRILLWALLVTLVLVCGVTIAYMYRATNDVTNKLIPGNVDCEVTEGFDKTSGVKSSITVKNTGNIQAYIRVRLVSYWVDANGDIMPIASPEVSFEPGEDWQALDNSADTYIYTKPVAPEASTGNLLKTAITLQASDKGYRQVVEVFADAIQSKPLDAVKEAWGYTPNTN